MSPASIQVEGALIAEREGIDALMATLRDEGCSLIGPREVQGAIQYRPIDSVDDLPQGRIDEQAPGSYRLEADAERPDSLFRYTVGPQSLKTYLHPPSQRLWQAQRRDHKIHLSEGKNRSQPYAFFGVRACELAAVDIQASVFNDFDTGYSGYGARLNNSLMVAVNCTRVGSTCFCHSMGCGPGVTKGYDLVLTELFDPAGHHFLIESGSEAGRALITKIPGRPATEADLAEARCAVDAAALQLERSMPADADAVLRANAEHAHWNEVGERCLACGNCTLVCPTCFCTRVQDETSLDGTEAWRTLQWDSCFNPEFSFIHGGAIRRSIGARYRQWISHKLAYWHDQFGRSGCTGCGRCITWCPVGIDITQEVRNLSLEPTPQPSGPGGAEHG